MTMNRLESRLGSLKAPLAVHLIPVSAMGSSIARFFPDKNTLVISALYTDLGAVRSWIATEYPTADEESSMILSQALPGFELARELSRALLFGRAPKAFAPESHAAWLQAGIAEISRRSWLFLVLSGLATGASWLCYYHALQVGAASKVVPIDKLSVVITLALAFVVLHEPFTAKSLIGCALITAGTLFMVL